MEKKSLFSIILILFSLLGFFNFVYSQEKVEINFFYSPTCPHCEEEKKLLDQLEIKYPDLEIKRFSVFEKENIELLKGLYIKYNVAEENQGLVPITFTEKNYFIGFNQEIGQELEKCILACQPENDYRKTEGASVINLREKISLPLLGQINLSNFSPFSLAVVLGVLDGFNACAMTALAFLLAVLIATKLRKRVFLIGGVFIFISGLVYFIFTSAWLNLFLAVEQIKFITYLVGLVIVIFAIFMLKDWFHGTICKLCSINPENQNNVFVRWERKLFKKMENLSSAKASLGITLLAVAGVAAGVNMVELACSFGFPLAFTKMLTLMNLSAFQYYFYIFIYILFYMIDDMIIFLIAVLTMRLTKASDKYLKIIKLISGIILLLLGLTMIIKPEILTLVN